MTSSRFLVLIAAAILAAWLGTLAGLSDGAVFGMALLASCAAWGGMKGFREGLHELAMQRWQEGSMRPRVFDPHGIEVLEGTTITLADRTDNGTVRDIRPEGVYVVLPDETVTRLALQRHQERGIIKQDTYRVDGAVTSKPEEQRVDPGT